MYIGIGIGTIGSVNEANLGRRNCTKKSQDRPEHNLPATAGSACSAARKRGTSPVLDPAGCCIGCWSSVSLKPANLV